MSWLNLNESLNNLKGQITNFASEVLLENSTQESGDTPASSNQEFQELQVKCQKQELELTSLKKLNEDLHAALERERLTRQNGVKENEESNWYWDPAPTQTHDSESDAKYKAQIQALQNEISSLKERALVEQTPVDSDDEINRLREENQALTNNLEDLDSQHQLAMERLLSLKKELQENFEVLKKDHEEIQNANEGYVDHIRELQIKLEERDRELQSLVPVKESYETLQHKYQNLERIHSLLRENAEKFQEENQDLHEEVFKLQEQVTKLEHDIEVSAKNQDLSKTVPKEKYDDVVKELAELKESRSHSQDQPEETNIDDNAKSVIEKLKREINELKHKINNAESNDDQKSVKSDKIMQLYNKYVNFELPIDYVGAMPSTGDNVVMYKLESAFKTLYSFKKEIDKLEHTLSEKTLNISHLKTEMEDLTTENEILSADVHHLEKELTDMKKNNDFLIKEIANIKNTTTLQPIIETHEDNIIKLESELEDCTKINKTFESKIKAIEKELSSVSAEKVSLQSSLEDLKEKYTAMLNEFEMCKTQINAFNEFEHQVMDNEHAELVKKYTKEIDELKKLLTASNTKCEKAAIDLHIVENDKVLLTKEIDDLKHDLQNKTAQCDNLDRHKTDLDARIKEVQSKLEEFERNNTELERNNNALKESIRSLESDDIKNDAASKILEVENKQLIERLDRLSVENHTLSVSLENALSDVTTLKEREEEMLIETETNKKELDSLTSKLLEMEKATEVLKSNLSDQNTLQNQLSNLKAENKDLISHKLQLEVELAAMKDKAPSIETEVAKIEQQVKDRDSIIHSLNETVTINVQEIERLKKLSEEYKTVKDQKEKELKELNQTLLELQEKINANTNTSEDNDEQAKIIAEKEAAYKEVETLKTKIDEKEHKLLEIQNKTAQVETTCEQYKQAVENVNKEKAELINLISLKHNESIQYHNEIQRLNQVLLEQTNEYKKILEEHEKHKNQTLSCTKCDDLTLKLKEQENIIQNLSKTNTEQDIMKIELVKAMETVKVLSEKCENLDKSLAIQLETVKQLSTENAQLSEREANSSRELDRLRLHLVETEENYTQELMAAEQKLVECQNRLTQVEDRAKQTSTVYTSNSIRANQEVETLRSQLRLCEQSRGDLERRVSEIEDARSKSEAATVNLQLALLQFQNDKDRDIDAATEKIRNKMAELRNQNGDLQQEILRLNAKLEESMVGLQAATRLGDQLETKTAIINDLKEQVRTLQTSVTAAEERYYAAVSNQQDRVDKNLVKNLVVNYVLAQAQNASNRTQVLRILSSVLDFNQSECERLGLSRSHSGAQHDSLAAEFVKFLEKESRPSAVVVPNMVPMADRDRGKITSATKGPTSTPSSNPAHSRNPSTGSNNILFTNIQNIDIAETSSQRSIDNSSVHSMEHKLSLPTTIGEDTGVNQTRNNEGAILMHVLRDV